MAAQRKTQVTVIVDGESRFTFPSVAKAKRFADKLDPARHIAVEFI